MRHLQRLTLLHRHQLAKIAPVHYSVNSNAKIKGEKPEVRVIVHITFCSVKIRDISLSQTAIQDTEHSIRIRNCPEKFSMVGNPTFTAETNTACSRYMIKVARRTHSMTG